MYLVSAPYYWTRNKTTSRKNQLFWSNTYKLEVMINFSWKCYQNLVPWPHLQYDLDHVMKFCGWRNWQKSWCHNLFSFKIPLFYKGPSIFADIIKIVTTFIKTIFKNSIKFQKTRNYLSKCNLHMHFLTQQNLLISGGKILMSTDLKGYVTWFIYFLDLL